MAAARHHGVQTMFTLSGGHVFPLYDGAVKADPPLRIVDVRHEQSAVFAAEATARLTRRPGLAVLTAGPGVTNGISAITTAHFNGAPVVIMASRAPDYRWGSGSLQEIDHPLLVRAVTKRAWTEHRSDLVGPAADEAFTLASARHRGPVFLDVSLEALFGAATPAAAAAGVPQAAARLARDPAAPAGPGPATAPGYRRPGGDRPHRRAAGPGQPAGADPRLRRVAGRRRGRRARRRRGAQAAGDPERPGPRDPAGRP